MVETALVLPLAVALMLAVLTGGNAYYKKISLVDAVREGARFGASIKVPAGGIGAWRTAVQDRVVELAGGQLTAADVCTDLVVPTGVNTSCGVHDPSGASTDPTALQPASLVKVSAIKATRLEFLVFSRNVTLSARVAGRYERDLL